MASPYPQAASMLHRRRTEGPLRICIALVFSVWLSTTSTATAQPTTLRPYTAHYQTTARGFDLTVTRELSAGDHGEFILRNGGKLLVAGFYEISVFAVADGHVQPISYVYRGTGLVSRHRELRFNRDDNSIDSLYRDQWYQLPWHTGTLDRMNQMEQLRLLLMRDSAAAREVTFRIADGKRLKDSQLVLVGEETLQTGLGPVQTLHYQRLHNDKERKSDLWFAPQWDYLMVRTLHIEDGDPVELLLTSATLDGEAVAVH